VTGKKIGRIIAIVAAVIIALLAGAAVLVKMLVSPEMVKRTVLPKISAQIERQVTLGDVEVSIFRGIRLRDLTIREKDGSGPFLQAGAIRLSYRFWPLLAGRVEVDEVLLEAPVVKIIRYADGSFNFTDLKKQKPAQAEAPQEKSRLQLQITKAGLSGGRVSYEDRQAGGKGFTTGIDDIGLAASGISLDGEFPLELDATVAGVKLSLAGTVARVGSAPAVTADLTLVAKDLAVVAKGLPPALGAKLTKLALGGGVEARLKLAGEVKQPKQLLRGGEIKLADLQLTAGGMRPSLAGALVLGSDSLESRDLSLTVGSQKLAVSLVAKNLTARPVKVSLALEGDKLDLNQLLPARKGGAAAATAVPPPSREEPGPVNIPVEATGSVKFSSLLYRTLALENPALAWRLQANVLTVDSLKAGVAGGSFSATARADLGSKGFAYSSRLEVKGVQADKLVTAFAPKAAGALSGTLALTAGVNGRGVATLKRNLAGSGSFDVANGTLSGDGFMPTLAAFLGINELRLLRFSKLGGTYLIKNETVSLDAKLDGSDAKLAATGRVGFDKAMDMGIDLRLAPALTGRIARGSVGSYVTDKEGWGNVPLRVTGMVNKPAFSLDAAKVRGKVTETLRQKIGEKLLELDDGKGEQPRPERKILNDTLRGIFGN